MRFEPESDKFGSSTFSSRQPIELVPVRIESSVSPQQLHEVSQSLTLDGQELSFHQSSYSKYTDGSISKFTVSIKTTLGNIKNRIMITKNTFNGECMVSLFFHKNEPEVAHHNERGHTNDSVNGLGVILANELSAREFYLTMKGIIPNAEANVLNSSIDNPALFR